MTKQAVWKMHEELGPEYWWDVVSMSPDLVVLTHPKWAQRQIQRRDFDELWSIVPHADSPAIYWTAEDFLASLDAGFGKDGAE
jgi:hypothetical protein